MVTLPIPGVAFDLASFSFHVPICGSAAKDTAANKKENASVKPIVCVFMAHIQTGFRDSVNAFLCFELSFGTSGFSSMAAPETWPLLRAVTHALTQARTNLNSEHCARLCYETNN